MFGWFKRKTVEAKAPAAPNPAAADIEESERIYAALVKSCLASLKSVGFCDEGWKASAQAGRVSHRGARLEIMLTDSPPLTFAQPCELYASGIRIPLSQDEAYALLRACRAGVALVAAERLLAKMPASEIKVCSMEDEDAVQP